ncbi:hypothetical protein PM082_023732 [Marasmius tenuissimus]|nr:hypothetical protein PM082_023732 [Marasmius tenuissimus]
MFKIKSNHTKQGREQAPALKRANKDVYMPPLKRVRLAVKPSEALTSGTVLDAPPITESVFEPGSDYITEQTAAEAEEEEETLDAEAKPTPASTQSAPVAPVDDGATPVMTVYSMNHPAKSAGSHGTRPTPYTGSFSGKLRVFTAAWTWLTFREERTHFSSVTLAAHVPVQTSLKP